MVTAEKCASCGASPLVTKPDDGTCVTCGVDPFLVEIVGQKRALADAFAHQSEDLHAFVDKLADMLETGFAEHTEVKRSGLFTKHISEIVVTVGNMVYRLTIHGKHATAHRSRFSRGIKLKEDKIEMKEFLDALSADLADTAAESQAAKNALSKFVK
jgi:hypothetical protein